LIVVEIGVVFGLMIGRVVTSSDLRRATRLFFRLAAGREEVARALAEGEDDGSVECLTLPGMADFALLLAGAIGGAHALRCIGAATSDADLSLTTDVALDMCFVDSMMDSSSTSSSSCSRPGRREF
jgi:hypothetical protein